MKQIRDATNLKNSSKINQIKYNQYIWFCQSTLLEPLHWYLLLAAYARHPLIVAGVLCFSECMVFSLKGPFISCLTYLTPVM